jgi:hypothetical protein
MSDDTNESNTSIMEAVRDKVVLDLKRQALACKQAENTNEALQFLKQSKQVAAATSLEDLPSNDLQCVYLKSLAVHRKSTGDLEGAMSALKQAEQLQAEANENEEEEDHELKELHNESREQEAAGVAFTDEEMMDEDMMTEFQKAGMEVPSQEIYQQRILAYKKKALALKKQANDVAGATAELRKAKQLEKVMSSLVNGATQQASLDGDNNIDRWMDTLTPEESELLGELMKPINASDEVDMPIDEANATQSIDWQNLETLEDSDIRDFLDMGIVELPAVPELLKLAEDAQKQAVGFKQNGNVEKALAKLVESKKIKLQAVRLERIYRETSTGGGEDGDTVEDLEKLLLGDAVTSTIVSKKEEPVNPWLLKPAAEIKAEVVRLKDAKMVSAASKLLHIYKQVLQKETEARESSRCIGLTAKINLELDLCRRQLQLYSFYKTFVDETVGSEQIMLWTDYDQQCRQAITTIEKKGSTSISLAHPKSTKLEVIQSGDDGDQQFISSMIECSTAPHSLNGRLEVSILEVLNISENKTIQKLIKKRRKEQQNNDGKEAAFPQDDSLYRQIQVDVKVQLPPGDGQSSNNAGGGKDETALSNTLVFLPNDEPPSKESPATQDMNTRLAFSNSPQSVWLPRGDSNKERALLRRMERKKVEFHLVHNPNITKKKEKPSWFWKSSDSDAPTEPPATTNLGKVVLELKDLLNRNCIAGDFPLVVNTKSVGGIVRLCLRTDSPLDPTHDEEADESNGSTNMKMYTKKLLFSKAAAN